MCCVINFKQIYVKYYCIEIQWSFSSSQIFIYVPSCLDHETAK